MYDPKTSTLKVVEAHRVVLRSKLRPTQKELDEDAARQAERQTNFVARQTLGMEFGTKKAKKALLSFTENAIKKGASAEANGAGPVKDALTTAMLDTMVGAEMPTKEEQRAVVDDAKPRPRPHLDTDKPQDVYPIDELIPEDAMMALYVKDWTDAAEKNEAVQTHSRFVARRLHALAVKKDIKRLKILRYILALVDFNAACTTLSKGGKKLPKDRSVLKESVKHAGDAVLGEIQRKFAQKGYVHRLPPFNCCTRF
jgi:DNA-directed RNA polymerase I subunit RPA49